LIAREGGKAVTARLEEYATDVPGLADWEVRGIVEFGRAYQMDREQAEAAQA
jgi:hypothetical protein